MSSPAKSEHRRSLSSHTQATSMSDGSLPLPGLSYRAPHERIQPAPYRVPSAHSSIITTDSWKEVYKPTPPSATAPPAHGIYPSSSVSDCVDVSHDASQPSNCQAPLDNIPSSPRNNVAESSSRNASEHGRTHDQQAEPAVTKDDHLGVGLEAFARTLDLFPVNIPPPPKINRDGNHDQQEVMDEVRESLSYIGETTHASLQSQLRFQSLIIENQVAGFKEVGKEVGERLSAIQEDTWKRQVALEEEARKRQVAYEEEARKRYAAYEEEARKRYAAYELQQKEFHQELAQRQDMFLTNQSLWMEQMRGMMQQVTSMVVGVTNAGGRQ